MTACYLASSPLPVAGGSTPPVLDTSITYTSEDEAGNIYALEITAAGASLSMGIISGGEEYSPSGASLSMGLVSGEAVYAYAPKADDTYKLTITIAADKTTKISTGTVKSFDPLTFIFLLLCSNSTEFSVTIASTGNSIASFSADIPLNAGGTQSKPTTLKPASGTISGSYSYTDPTGLGSATITFSGGSSGTFTMNAIIFGMPLNASGTYTVVGNKITCTTTASDETESIGDIDIFTIIDEKTLRDEEHGDPWIKK